MDSYLTLLTVFELTDLSCTCDQIGNHSMLVNVTFGSVIQKIKIALCFY